MNAINGKAVFKLQLAVANNCNPVEIHLPKYVEKTKRKRNCTEMKMYIHSLLHLQFRSYLSSLMNSLASRILS